jgi:hypothetical protein
VGTPLLDPNVIVVVVAAAALLVFFFFLEAVSRCCGWRLAP